MRHSSDGFDCANIGYYVDMKEGLEMTGGLQFGFSKPPPSATRPQLLRRQGLEKLTFSVKHSLRRYRRSREQRRFIQTQELAQSVLWPFPAYQSSEVER